MIFFIYIYMMHVYTRLDACIHKTWCKFYLFTHLFNTIYSVFKSLRALFSNISKINTNYYIPLRNQEKTLQDRTSSRCCDNFKQHINELQTAETNSWGSGYVPESLWYLHFVSACCYILTQFNLKTFLRYQDETLQNWGACRCGHDFKQYGLNSSWDGREEGGPGI